MKYKWLIKDDVDFSPEILKLAYDSKIIAQLLYNRNIKDSDKIAQYLYSEKYIPTNPEEIPQLVKAKERILKAISLNEKITIFGDYDVDGVTSTSCLLLTLRAFTKNVDFYIPNRLKEGYGLNEDAVKKIARSKTNLLITCDCGITNHKEIDLANSLGMDVIVTDHHSLPEELPKAVAVLNPKQLPENHKLHFLPGVGVAYKLAESLLENSDVGLRKEDLLDLVTLGMIADMVPLVDENRYLVQTGISYLAHTKKVGLRELLNTCGLKKENGVSTDNVGFGIAPRINAVGRLTDAALGVKLLTTENEIEALHLATELDIQNKDRQIICEQTYNEAIDIIEEKGINDKCIVLAQKGWHHGVIGIVASRILEKYHLPTLLICVEDGMGKASGRSIEALNIVDALHKHSRLLERYGGHKAACGLSIKEENIDAFINSFTQTVNESLSENQIEAILKIDAKLDIHQLSMDLIKKINKLAPFGLGNPMPVFYSENLEIATMRQIGKDGKHLKLFLKDLKSQRFFEALVWNYTSYGSYDLNPKDKIKIAFTPKINFFNGEESVQLEIKDLDLMESKISAVPPSSEQIVVYDHRGKLKESLSLLDSDKSTAIFAERNQKNLLPVISSSRNKIKPCEILILADTTPDEKTFREIIIRSNPKEIYLSYGVHFESTDQNLYAMDILKKLSGMMLYVANQKNGIIPKVDLEAALGLNRLSLTYAVEVLMKSEFLTYTQDLTNINISIIKSSCQINTKLIEYNLFVGELKEIFSFRERLIKTSINELNKMVTKIIESSTVKIQNSKYE